MSDDEAEAGGGCLEGDRTAIRAAAPSGLAESNRPKGGNPPRCSLFLRIQRAGLEFSRSKF
jgi:hypothetical protein